MNRLFGFHRRGRFFLSALGVGLMVGIPFAPVWTQRLFHLFSLEYCLVGGAGLCLGVALARVAFASGGESDAHTSDTAESAETPAPVFAAEAASHPPPEPVSEGRLASFASRYGLSRRETQVLALLMQGLSDGEAAVRLDIKKPTLRTMIHRMKEKTGTSNRDALTRLTAGNSAERRHCGARCGQSARELSCEAGMAGQGRIGSCNERNV